ncbi:MAG: MraY family glycosyltransferase [Syntrophales bacterium]|nr:MraY family glycosyltransferase [Syntrophales bacterium]
MFSFEHRKFSLLKIYWIVALLIFIVILIPAVRGFFFNQVGRWLYILLFSFSLCALLTPPVKVLAKRLSIMDVPAERKIHDNSTPLLGGLGIIIAFSAALLSNMILDKHMVVLLYTGGIIALVSFFDDWKGLPAKFKLLVQILLVLILIWNDIILELFPINLWWGYALNALLTIIWIVGITNSMNFIDGMDGLATGLSAIIAFFLCIVAFQTYQPILGWIALAMLGSCLGFLPYNFRLNKPASIFLGDTGSIFIGFVLSSLAIIGEWSDNNPIVSFSAPVLIFWVLIFDMTYITIERVMTGKVKSVKQWLDYVGKDHLHHRTYTLLGDKRKAVLFIYLLSATLGISAIALRNARPVDAILLVIQAFLITVVISILDYSGRHRE